MNDQEVLSDLTETYLKTLISQVSDGLDSEFDSTAPFGELGVDSFHVLKIVKLLEQDFGRLPKTLLFENFNIADLTGYFVANHDPVLREILKDEVGVITDRQPDFQEVDKHSKEWSNNGRALIATTNAKKEHVKPKYQEPILTSVARLGDSSELQSIVHSLFEKYKNESAVSRGLKVIAPNLFIGSRKLGYFNYSQTENQVLAYSFTGSEEEFPIVVEEFQSYCKKRQLELNILTNFEMGTVGEDTYTSTPFGAIQRITDLSNFSLAGSRMRRLRYQVRKYEKTGNCQTEEYICGSDASTERNIVEVIDQWCAQKTMVNPLVLVARDEILRGVLDPQHRIFLTTRDDRLENVVIISAMSEDFKGYLMDLEFYLPDMTLGGLEFAIVNIIQKLVGEGNHMLSLGATFGPKLAPSSTADIALDSMLDELREQKIFSDEGNLQFKNKFRPENGTIFLCRSAQCTGVDGITDIIMMIADPQQESQTGKGIQEVATANELKIATSDSATGDAAARNTHVARGTASDQMELQTSSRLATLTESGFNPLNANDCDILFDMKTDSWAQLDFSEIHERKHLLRSQLQQPIDIKRVVKDIFPFEHILLTDSGRAAEGLFCASWKSKGVVVQNLLFPTWIYHQIDQGFTPKELPAKSIFDIKSDAPSKGEIDLDELTAELEGPSSIAFVCIELDNNAAGGCAVSLEHLRDVKSILKEHSVPLVIDATRIIENALSSLELKDAADDIKVWELVRQTLTCADVVTASLCKDFGLWKGGLVATNDEELGGRIQLQIDHEGSGLDIIEKKIIALALQNKNMLLQQVRARMLATHQLWTALGEAGAPVTNPCGAHCVLLDVSKVPEFSRFDNPVASFLAWVYLNTGIRAGAHSVGLQKQTSLNQLVRLAVPVGYTVAQTDDLCAALVALFTQKRNIPELIMCDESKQLTSKVHANYSLNALHFGQMSASIAEEKIAHLDVASTKSAEMEAAPVTITRENEVPTDNSSTTDSNRNSDHYKPQDIAVIGMAGRYPKASNMSELWENLLSSRDCIETIPVERQATRWQESPIENYRGGFIDDVDKFDSLFFNVSPREAQMLDPQERLFLEVAWEALEDAGYYPETMVEEGSERNVGVFVGAVWAMYQTYGMEQRLVGRDVNPNSFLWSIANRVSYFMNLCGPSMTIDTACSSSLTAIHLACESIFKGECKSAIVGGVNLDIHQCKQEINLSLGALSEDGLCRSFGDGANGYVPGEGVGALLLKPLSDAQRDGDSIYGVVKSSVVNHGGRTSGYTVPSPKAQTDLITSALDKASIDARTIGYIEAHGTGTELGDPIEISGLTKAFEADGVEKQTCAIGSVKSNVGHLEAAAGLIGVCKVLLQMKHKKLVPSLHSSKLNEHIEFEESPFYVEQKVEDWQPKTVDGMEYPLRAGVSSFGAGGANAHVILECIEDANDKSLGSNKNSTTLAFPLSARNESALQQYATKLIEYLEGASSAKMSVTLLEDLAYTLQVGRKSFEHRMVVLASSFAELKELLSAFLAGKKDKNLLQGQLSNASGITKLLSRKEKRKFIDMIYQGREPLKLGQLWVDGILADWQAFRQNAPGKIISLPTYPFADRRHWAAKYSDTEFERSGSLASLHPMIDTNESTFEKQLFRKTFRADEFFIQDHLVSDVPTLPGVAYLELARKAGELAADRKVQKIRNILWVSPLAVENDKATEAFIELKAVGDAVQFEVYGESEEAAKQLYSQGKLYYASAVEEEQADEYIELQDIKARCEKVIDGKDAYPLFTSFGLDLGHSFQALQEVYKNEKETLGSLKLPQARESGFEDFVLHPALIDGSLQAAVAAQLGDKLAEMFVPFTIKEVEILHPLTTECYSYVTATDVSGKVDSNVSRIDVRIVDANGKVLIKISESIGVPLNDVHEKSGEQAPLLAESAEYSEQYSELFYTNQWIKSPIDSADTNSLDASSLIVFARDEVLQKNLATHSAEKGSSGLRTILVKPGKEFACLEDGSYTVNPEQKEGFTQLLEKFIEREVDISNICFAWGDSNYPTDSKALVPLLNQGAYSMLFLCQALADLKLKQKTRIVYSFTNDGDEPQPHNEAINGLIKTIQVEHPKLLCKTVEVRGKDASIEQFLLSELDPAVSDDVVVRYESQERYTRTVRKIERDDIVDGNGNPNDIAGIKNKGVYLITGGLGGLGIIFAKFLAEQCQARLVLTGRSALDAAGEEKLEELRRLGADPCYLETDVSDYKLTKVLAKKVRKRFGQLNGVIHSAGVIRDSYLMNKTRTEMKAVLAPKVFGTINLDRAFREEKLDFFVTFSSLAAIGGNAGQCDYAYGNHFMDSFAARRQVMSDRGERFGKSLSINWSIWADGGMKIDEQTEIFFKRNLGILPLSTEVGLSAFALGLASDMSQFIALEGLQEKVESAWGLNKKKKEVTEVVDSPVPVVVSTQSDASSNNLLPMVRERLAKGVMDFLQIGEEDMSFEAILLDLGFDSIGLTTYSNWINEQYDLDLTPVLFFEYQTLKEIAEYIATDHKEEVMRVHQSSSTAQSDNAVGKLTPSVQSAVTTEIDSSRHIQVKRGLSVDSNDRVFTQQASMESLSPGQRFAEQPIAIVGMSGVMPQSENMDEFWRNLKNEQNMITVIPRDRWDWEDYYGDPVNEPNKSNSKWGGFMKEIDKFDPLFFGISPKEAELMDPQQRIFLESVWSAIEDSGHKVSDLSGTKTGLFVGVATNDYSDLISHSQIGIEAYSSTGNSHAVLVNRVSYLLNLLGPSAPLDTACSSSLIALHRAIASIHTKSCDMAIVGGVQVMAVPSAYIAFGNAGMLSDDGKCKTFDKEANGYVRGEGSGAILLKPLSKAEEDGDHIYAIVKSTAENHGGRAASLTAPSPNSQTELLLDAYESAQIDPTTVGYIECHGTGTSLGDPIEFQALKKSFAELYRRSGKDTPKHPHCGLGSVKTNIGHLETAAGIAGILKTVLAMKHKTLPGSLHFDEINPYINLKDSPFRIVDRTQPWEALVDENGNDIPRRAGISSFGFGGANSHIVLEEYIPHVTQETTNANQQQVVVLSAKKHERLVAYAKNLLAHLEQHDVPLDRLAYTLQVGRDALESRFATVVDSVDELKAKLAKFTEGSTNGENIHVGDARSNKKSASPFDSESDIEQIIEKWVGNGQLNKLAKLWATGIDLDWTRIYPAEKPMRISLPTYPFARERYWIDTSSSAETSDVGIQTAVIHPLLHKNISNFSRQKYYTKLSGKEGYFGTKNDVGNKALTPAAHLEMVGEAVMHAVGVHSDNQFSVTLDNIVWSQPILVNGSAKELTVGLTPDKHGDINYSISQYQENDDAPAAIYSEGEAKIVATSSGYLNLDELRKDELFSTYSVEENTNLFDSLGIDSSPSQRNVDRVFNASNGVLVELSKSNDTQTALGRTSTSVGLLDSAIQYSLWALVNRDSQENESSFSRPFPYYPYALSHVELNAFPSAGLSWIWARYSSESDSSDNVVKMDLDLCDSDGQVRMRLRGFAFENRERRVDHVLNETNKHWLTLREDWLDAVLPVDESLWVESIKKKNDHSIMTITQNEEDHLAIKGFCEKLAEVAGNQGTNWSIRNLPIDCQQPSTYDNRAFETAITDETKPLTVFMFLPQVETLEEKYQQLEATYNSVRSIMRIGATRPVYFYCCHSQIGSEESPLHQGLAGLFKSAMMEAPNHRYRSISYESDLFERNELALKVVEEWLWDSTDELNPQETPMVRYIENQRQELSIKEFSEFASTEQASSFRTGATYLMIGALGEVGELICQELGRHYQAKLLIFSRRPEEDVSEQLERIRKAGAEVIYRSVDILDLTALQQAMDSLKREEITINGVVHMARQVLDASIVDKEYNEFARTIAAKVQGTLNVDQVTSEEPLEFFMLYSSVAAFGIKGSPDYAYSTAFQNSFARRRQQLQVQGERNGRSIAICWGQWNVDGGVAPEKMQARLDGMKMVGIDTVDVKSALLIMRASLESSESVAAFIAVHDRQKTIQVMGFSNLTNLSDVNVLKMINAFESSQLTRAELVTAMEHLDFDSLLESTQNRIIQLIRSLENQTTERFVPDQVHKRAPASSISPVSRPMPAVGNKKSNDHVNGTNDSSESTEDSKAHKWIVETMQTVLKIKPESIEFDKPFQDYGLDSISAVQLTVALEKKIGVPVPPNWLIEHPNITELSDRLKQESTS